MGEFQLFTELTKLSNAKTWDLVKLEWRLSDISYADNDNPLTCICGHYPIKELCHLKNKENGNDVIVGNCCVNKFILKSKKIFDAINRVRNDLTNSFNVELIDIAHQHNIINDWEKEFYIDIWRKHKLNSKQLRIKVDINFRYLQKMKINGSYLSDIENIRKNYNIIMERYLRCEHECDYNWEYCLNCDEFENEDHA